MGPYREYFIYARNALIFSIPMFSIHEMKIDPIYNSLEQGNSFAIR